LYLNLYLHCLVHNLIFFFQNWADTLKRNIRLGNLMMHLIIHTYPSFNT
jgi:hypothetical protein